MPASGAIWKLSERKVGHPQRATTSAAAEDPQSERRAFLMARTLRPSHKVSESASLPRIRVRVDLERRRTPHVGVGAGDAHSTVAAVARECRAITARRPADPAR